jgi:hypothetical protein
MYEYGVGWSGGVCEAETNQFPKRGRYGNRAQPCGCDDEMKRQKQGGGMKGGDVNITIMFLSVDRIASRG